VLMLMSCGDAGTYAWDPTETRRGVLLLYKWDKWLRPEHAHKQSMLWYVSTWAIDFNRKPQQTEIISNSRPKQTLKKYYE